MRCEIMITTRLSVLTGNIYKQPLFVIVLFHVAPLTRGWRVLVVVAEKKGNHQAGEREESYARSLEARQPGAIVEESEEGLDCAAIEVSYEGLRHPCIGGGEKPPPHQVIH
ncbi:hypothetical protein VPH35_023834 [Triticum aestivum]